MMAMWALGHTVNTGPFLGRMRMGTNMDVGTVQDNSENEYKQRVTWS
jgi:hypothetical protein